ncbi:eCIS core domain-containing protein [Rhodobacter sp. NSM]|uniref:eCIS core domain-containing protein n=1 Tax=Rhodobacter sp. NSM TaxID=3457501 RepID=UPI003FD03E70
MADPLADAGAFAHALALVGEQQAVAMLATAIEESRRQALSEGTAAIPEAVRLRLEGQVPAIDLEMVRWRVGGGGEFSLQRNAILHGNASAITLGEVVVFADEGEALANVPLWAHELRHVGQYRDWGVVEFARRYLRDYRAVEADAVAFAAEVASAQAQRLPDGARVAPPRAPW